MAGQASLLSRLLALLQEVEALKGDEHHEERLAAVQRVEAELVEIEATVNPGTAVGKQQAGLLALVRSALESDQRGDNESLADWSDEGLLKAHGLATYASQQYWDEAYAGGRYGASFDWYGGWEQPDAQGRSLAELLRPLLAKDARILMLGCGNSNMSVLMYGEGYHHITNVDIAEAAVEHMRRLHGHLEGMAWQTMDAGAMDFANDTFDIAIEKGLFDALYAGTGARVMAVLSEAQRVLRPGGQLLSVSFAQDRLARLFGEDSSPEGAAAPAGDVTPAQAPLKCRVAGELEYEKSRNNGTNRTSQEFYVYACNQPS